MRYLFVTTDGSSLEAVVYGEAMDSGDKATNKAMSAAHKYALLQTFLIPTEDVEDSDADETTAEPDHVPASEDQRKRIEALLVLGKGSEELRSWIAERGDSITAEQAVTILERLTS
jgi:hypothetical protein